MKIDKNSVRFKVLTPLFLLIGVITLSMLLIAYQISHNLSEDYRSHAASISAREIKEILEKAVTVMVSSKLTSNEIVIEAQKKAVVDEIASYLQTNNVEGGIFTNNGDVVYSSLDKKMTGNLFAASGNEGHIHVGSGIRDIHGYVIHFPMWNWRIINISEPSIPWVYRKQIIFLILCIVFGSAVTAGSVFLIMSRNFHAPLKKVLFELRENRTIGMTEVSELDTIGSAINDAITKLNKKTEQYQALHNIAISLHEGASSDEIFNMIIEKAGLLIGAELAAIALYDETGGFKSLIARGVTIKTVSALPEGKGILEYMRLSLTPVRIENVAAHPAFSGSFPKGHPAVGNLLGYPIFSGQGRPIGALYFGNKHSGFTEEDEVILKAISADAAIAISKAESLTQLRRFKQVIDSAFDVIIITDSSGYITYANPAFEALTEYSPEDYAGKKTNILKSGYHDNSFYRNLWDTIKAGDVWKGEFTNRKKSGGIYYVSAVIFPIYTDGSVSYASIQRDITHEKKLYEQLLRAQKMEAIGTLAGGIAHDFNNLLTAILGYSEIMLSSSKEGDQFHRPASIIFNAAEKGAELAKKILTVTRKEKMETKPVNLNEIIKNSLELLLRSIPKNIEIVTSLAENIPPIKADPTQMQQVIMNLAVNARDAMHDGGVLTIETSLVGYENGAANGIPAERSGFVKLSVSDTGTGMDIETQRKIFDPFFTTKETGKGTGLGLYIVHSVINNHAGYINLYSEPNKGTRFSIYLQIAKEEDTEKLYASEEEIRGTETILIIDDDFDVRELCRDILEPLGYTVISAGSGRDGINAFRQMKDNISLVILDMIMPKMGGYEVFQALKTINPDVKVLLCSGYSYNGFAGIDKLLKSGVKSFIQKPFTRQSIAQAIKKALAG